MNAMHRNAEARRIACQMSLLSLLSFAPAAYQKKHVGDCPFRCIAFEGRAVPVWQSGGEQPRVNRLEALGQAIVGFQPTLLNTNAVTRRPSQESPEREFLAFDAPPRCTVDPWLIRPPGPFLEALGTTRFCFRASTIWTRPRCVYL